MRFDMHGVEFSEEEEELIRSIGIENEDYAICAVFENRNDAEIDYDEDTRLITIRDGEAEVEQTMEMITEVSESQDPLQRIGVGVSMLEVAITTEKQWRD